MPKFPVMPLHPEEHEARTAIRKMGLARLFHGRAVAGPLGKTTYSAAGISATLKICHKDFPMTLCPIAIVAGCQKCPAFRICPLKGVLGDQPARPEEPAKPVKKAAAPRRTAARKK